MQIQLSTHEFRIFYGDTFGDHLAAVIDGVGEYEIDFTLRWYKDYCVIALDKLTRKDWEGILTEVFDRMCE